MIAVLRSRSGQALLIALLILTVLVIAIPAVVYFNNHLGKHSVHSVKKQRARALAEQGISYATQILTDPVYWPPCDRGGLGRPLPTNFAWDNSLIGTVPFSVGGGTFTVMLGCTGNVYETKVTVDSFIAGERARYQALISNRTLGASSPNGLKAAAALQSLKVPSVSASAGTVFEVHWGPIAIFDQSATWNLTGDLDNLRYPRKFAIGRIQGSPNRPSPTDNKEYWMNTGLGFPPIIDVQAYRKWATVTGQGVPSPTFYPTTSVVPAPPYASCGGQPCLDPLNASPTGSGFFNPGAGTTVFHNYTLHASSRVVLFIQGDAEFQDVDIDLYPLGGIIVTGNLRLGRRTSGSTMGVKPGAVFVPETAPMEYPYTSTWPCKGKAGSFCNTDASGLNWDPSTNPINIRSFIYVQGNLNIPTGSVRLVGAMRVDGTITIGNGAGLRLYYDDMINHTILISPLTLQTDSLQELPPPKT